MEESELSMTAADPGEQDRLRLQADAYADARAYAQAEQLYRKILRQSPGDADTLNNLGALYWRTANWTAARTCFAHWARQHPADPEPLLWLARLAYNHKDFAAALQRYHVLAEQSALTLNDALAYLLCGERLGAKPESLRRRFVQLAGWSSLENVRERMALLYARSGDLRQAMTWLKPGAAAEPARDSRPASGAVLTPAAAQALAGKLGPGEVRILDDFFSPATLQALRRAALRHERWRSSSSAQEAVASLTDGLVHPILLRAAETLRAALSTRQQPLAVSAIWHYRYFANHTTPPAHADDGEIAVNVWLTPDEYCEDLAASGLRLWSNTAPADYFHADPTMQAAIVAQCQATDGAAREIAYRCNRAVVFHGRRIHQTAPYCFGSSDEARRMNVTFLYE